MTISEISKRRWAVEIALKHFPGITAERAIDIAGELEGWVSGSTTVSAPPDDSFARAGVNAAAAAALAAANKRLGGITEKDALGRLDDDSLAIVVLALREALQLGQNTIAPEHLLLAILREGKSDAAATLINLAGNGRNARAAVIKRMVGDRS